MNKLQIIEILNKYQFDKNKYMVISGAALVLLGIIDETNDINIACTDDYYNYLLNKYDCELECISHNKEVYYIDKIINVSTNYYNKDDIIFIDNLPIQKIEAIRNLKLKLNREKDKVCLELIDKYLNINPVTLAYLGDAVYEVYIRKHLLSIGILKVDLLQKEAVNYVSAKSQFKILQTLMERGKLSTEELEIIKKGRNAKGHKAPKNTDIVTYRYATGFETLIGYLYLFNPNRLEALIKEIIGE